MARPQDTVSVFWKKKKGICPCFWSLSTSFFHLHHFYSNVLSKVDVVIIMISHFIKLGEVGQKKHEPEDCNTILFFPEFICQNAISELFGRVYEQHSNQNKFQLCF